MQSDISNIVEFPARIGQQRALFEAAIEQFVRDEGHAPDLVQRVMVKFRGILDIMEPLTDIALSTEGCCSGCHDKAMTTMIFASRNLHNIAVREIVLLCVEICERDAV